MQSILQRLVKGSFVYGSGDFLTKIIGFLLIPVYTRFLTTSDYGIVALAASVLSILGILLGMGLRGAVVRNYYDYRERAEEVAEYIGTTFIFYMAVGILVVAALTLFGQSFFENLLPEVPFHPYITLTIWTAFFVTTGGILFSLYRAREQAKRYVVLHFGQFLLSMVLILYFVVALNEGALGKIKGSFFAGLVFFLIFLFLTMRESKISFSATKLKHALLFGLPLIPHALAGWVLAAMDRILLERMTTLSEVGLYNLGYQIGLVMGLLVFSINSAWSPIFYDTAKRVEDAKKIFARIFTIYSVAISTIAVGLILFSREIIIIAAAKPFHEAHTVVPAVVVGYLFQGLYFMSVTPIFYKKKTHLIPIITIISAAVNIVLNLLWIPQYGMLGAAYATLVAFGVLFLLTHTFAQRCYKIPHDYKRIAGIGILVAGVYIINSIMDFQGIFMPILIKIIILLIFIAGMPMLRIITFKEIKRIKNMIPKK